MTTVAVHFGPECFDALRDALQGIRAGDPLAPVDVAVPSSFVGVTVRRRLAAPGLVGVRFAPLPRVIADRALPVLAGQGVPPLTTAQRRAATKAVLAGSNGELAASARKSGSTTEVVAGVFAELDDADADEATLLNSGPSWSMARRDCRPLPQLPRVGSRRRPTPPARGGRAAQPHHYLADRLLAAQAHPRRVALLHRPRSTGPLARRRRAHRRRAAPTLTPARILEAVTPDVRPNAPRRPRKAGTDQGPS